MEGRAKGLDKRESSLLFREIVPPHGWAEDENNHYLRLTLPGFKQPDVTLQIDKYGHLVVRGERQLSGHKFVSFHETFNLPKNINVEETSGEFEDGEIFCITFPKLSEIEQRRMQPVRDRYDSHNIRVPKEQQPYSTNIDGKSMGRPGSKRDNANDSNKQSTKKRDEFIDPEVPNTPKGKIALDTIESDEKSKTKMWVLIGLLVILLIVVVVPISVKLHK
ncbi:unnamed protein product [Fraxinus pennsylvanica]|uniref:SHSP domain-containing protein n=1 Tax=Fraxinus pennsylvanica TaxID=56036 RepID=A0AAD1ZPQ8_9LAMI|nr:unnamed protein product [Fraxinus pennsylvanica]